MAVKILYRDIYSVCMYSVCVCTCISDGCFVSLHTIESNPRQNAASESCQHCLHDSGKFGL